MVSGPEVMKNISCTYYSAKHEIFPAHKCSNANSNIFEQEI